MIDQRKVDQFFRLIRGVYGAGKFANQWPTDLDIQAAMQLWGAEISKHSPEELKAAIENAQRMAAKGEEDWQWPNIGLILSGAKRYATAAHRMFLPEPERQLVPKAEMKTRLSALREATGL